MPRNSLPSPYRRIPVATLTRVNNSLFLGYGIQGDVGLPGDPGQPMINGVVEFVGFPKGDKGMQVCCNGSQESIQIQTRVPETPTVSLQVEPSLWRIKC